MKRITKILLLAGTVIFLIQFSIAPLTHNHPQDLMQHFNCPAYILSITLLSFSISLFSLVKFNLRFLRRELPQEENKITQKSIFSTLQNRAPPL